MEKSFPRPSRIGIVACIDTLFPIFTYVCVSDHESTKILKCDDDTTVLGLITNSDESEYRDQISFCSENNLEHNLNKQKK